jgi:hypothetical protein
VLSKFRRARLLSHGFLGSLALILAAGSARADTMVWQNASGLTWSNVYSSPYYVTDQTTNQYLTLFCLDFNHEINPPTQWAANLNLLSPSNLGQFQYGGSYPNTPGPAFTGDDPGDGHAVTMQQGSDAYHRYLEAAWLFTNMSGAQAQSDTNDVLVSQVAAWLLFVDQDHLADLISRIQGTTGTFSFADYVGSQSLITQLNFRDAVDEAVNASQNAVLGGWTAGTDWTVITGDIGWINANHGGQPVQEFLTPTPVAEPASILSTGTFLLGACVLLRRSRTAKNPLLSRER